MSSEKEVGILLAEYPRIPDVYKRQAFNRITDEMKQTVTTIQEASGEINCGAGQLADAADNQMCIRDRCISGILTCSPCYGYYFLYL